MKTQISIPRLLRHLAMGAFLVSAMPTGASASPVEMTPAERSALLQQLEQLRGKYPDFQADFTEEKTSHLLNKPIVSEGSIAFEAPDKFRREQKGSSPSLSVCNGKTLWIYYPAFKQAEEYTLGQRAFFDESLSALTAGLNFQHIDDYYNFRAFKEDSGYRFELTPRKSNLKRILQSLTVKMGPEFKAERTEIVLPKGDQVVTTYKNSRRTPLPSSTFEFVPPADAQVTHPLGK